MKKVALKYKTFEEQQVARRCQKIRMPISAPVSMEKKKVASLAAEAEKEEEAGGEKNMFHAFVFAAEHSRTNIIRIPIFKRKKNHTCKPLHFSLVLGTTIFDC